MSLAFRRKPKPNPGAFWPAFLANCSETSTTSLTEAAQYNAPMSFSFPMASAHPGLKAPAQATHAGPQVVAESQLQVNIIKFPAAATPHHMTYDMPHLVTVACIVIMHCSTTHEACHQECQLCQEINITMLAFHSN